MQKALPSIPSESIGPQQQAEIAEAALRLIVTIRENLPIEGETRLKVSSLLIDRCFSEAGDWYTVVERIRNPKRRPHPGRPRGIDGYFHGATRHVGRYVSAVGLAMDAICLHYGWQGISDGSRLAHSDVRGGRTIPPIPGGLLDDLERHAKALARLAAEGLAVEWSADGATAPATGNSAAVANTATAAAKAVRPKRSKYDRDHLFLKWFETPTEEGFGSHAKIRDRWNHEHPDEGIGVKSRGREIVKKGIQKARAERAAAQKKL